MNNKYLATGLLFTAILVTPRLDAYAHDAEGTLDKISRTGEFVIGYRPNASPLSYENADGVPSGYSVDFCRRIAAAVKTHLGNSEIETKFVAISSSERISAVKDGKIDILCGSTTITMSRQKEVDFTLTTFVTGGSILSLSASGIQGMSDLSGKKVAVVKSTTTIGQLEAYFKKNLIDAEIVNVADRTEAMNRLNKGSVDAFASDQIVLIGQVIEALNPKQYSLMSETFSYEPYGLVVRRDDADFRLIANTAIAQLFRSGQHGQIYNKWIGRIGIRPSPILSAMYQLNTLPE
jgi:glutamate/aspartate transport system substrate-binding protein